MSEDAKEASFFMDKPVIPSNEPAPTDKPVKVYTEDPFSYNYVALVKSKVDELPIPTASVVMTDPLYYRVGKYLGIEDPHDWNKFYDKVYVISEWAKERMGTDDPQAILDWIKKASNFCPSMGSRKINDLYSHMRISIEKGKNEHRA